MRTICIPAPLVLRRKHFALEVPEMVLGRTGRSARGVRRWRLSCWLFLTNDCNIAPSRIEGMDVKIGATFNPQGILPVAASFNRALKTTAGNCRGFHANILAGVGLAYR